MVEIRTLQPLVRQRRLAPPEVRIRMPKRPKPYRLPSTKHIERRLVDFPPPTPQPTPCRLWQGVTDKNNYGRRWVRDGKGQKRRLLMMHRWTMEQVLGRRLKPYEIVLHACDQPLCYRLDHLSIGTIADNNADMFAKGRASAPPRNVRYGADNHNTKLTPADDAAILHAYRNGATQPELAKRYGVSRHAIGRHIRKQLP